MAEQYEFAGYVDLDEEVFLRANGERLTEAGAEALAESILAEQGRGRPSLGRGVSPKLNVRLPHRVKERLEAQAHRERRPVAAVTRDAIEAYLASHG